MKHRPENRNYAILQNDPMHQKIALLFQRHDHDQFRAIGDRSRPLAGAQSAERAVFVPRSRAARETLAKGRAGG
ncbi:MAG TPA: hypothetical protein VLV76_00450 [Candidatus Acidoferrum sp.]|nr:hypothetical protein [Candidatus Acidoferrum sp.]